MKKFRGFTLAEVMISLTIIGVIMVFYIPVHKVVSAQYTTLAYSVDETLNTVTKELMSGAWGPGNVESTSDSAIIELDGDLVLTQKSQAFCQHAANVMNTVASKTYCPADESDYSTIETGSNGVLGYKLANLDWNNPNIIGTNGYRYYLSRHYAKDADSPVSSMYGYRIVAVDMTGKKKPNKEDNYPVKPTGKPYDIVNFLILDDGKVLPLGIAATNRGYINARTIAYYYEISKVPSDLIETHASGCVSDPEALHEATEAAAAEGKQIDIKECGFWKENIKVTNPSTNEDEITYPFKDAFCLKYGQTTDFKGYNCNDPDNRCKIGGTADECLIELVKPIYKVKI